MFLATTALDKFWDKSQKILFLGDWCKLYNKKDKLKEIDYCTLPFEWDSVEKKSEAYDYCNLLYEKALIELAIELNKIHKLNNSVDFYRIILGNWLLRFIHQYYDKYIHILNAKNNYYKLNTYILDEDQFYVPTDIEDYLSKQIYDDRYNFQLYSDIIKFLNMDYKVKKLENFIIKKENIIFNNDIKSFLTRISSYCFKTLSLLNIFHKERIVIMNPYFKYNKILNMFKLFFRSKLVLIFDDFKYKINIKNNVDVGLRKKYKLSLIGEEFELLLGDTIMKHIPSLFLENFNNFNNEIKKLNIKNHKFYYTSQGLYFNNIFKFFIAANRPNIFLLNYQHGGAFGIDKKLANEDYERSISDIYYTWGWNGDKCRVLPYPKIIKKFTEKKDYFLFVMNNSPRYIYDFNFHAVSSNITDEYINNTKFFLKYINRDKIIMRTYPGKKHQTFLQERIEEEYTDIIYDDFTYKFDRMLSDCQLLIADHLTTTWLESLSMNKPTVVFTSKNYFECRDEAKELMKKLEDVGILFFDSKKAANHINNISNDIYKWWNNKKLQLVREEFISKYAYTSKNWMHEWINEFNKVIKENK